MSSTPPSFNWKCPTLSTPFQEPLLTPRVCSWWHLSFCSLRCIWIDTWSQTRKKLTPLPVLSLDTFDLSFDRYLVSSFPSVPFRSIPFPSVLFLSIPWICSWWHMSLFPVNTQPFLAYVFLSIRLFERGAARRLPRCSSSRLPIRIDLPFRWPGEPDAREITIPNAISTIVKLHLTPVEIPLSLLCFTPNWKPFLLTPLSISLFLSPPPLCLSVLEVSTRSQVTTLAFGSVLLSSFSRYLKSTPLKWN